MSELTEVYNKYKIGHCMCGRAEWCEACSGTSLFSRLMEDIDILINGPKPPLDYSASITITRKELDGS